MGNRWRTINRYDNLITKKFSSFFVPLALRVTLTMKALRYDDHVHKDDAIYWKILK